MAWSYYPKFVNTEKIAKNLFRVKQVSKSDIIGERTLTRHVDFREVGGRDAELVLGFALIFALGSREHCDAQRTVLLRFNADRILSRCDRLLHFLSILIPHQPANAKRLRSKKTHVFVSFCFRITR